MDYSAAAVPVAADPDGAADDGAADENDNLGTDIERLLGGSAADVLAGGTEIAGGDGGDSLTAAAAGTKLSGGPGGDTLTGGAGLDEFGGGAGGDRILARDGLAEIVACGEDLDVLDVDPVDQLAADCDLPDPAAGDASGTGGGPGPGGDGFGPRPGVLPPAPDLVLAPRPVSATSTPGVLSAEVSCAETAQDVCLGEVILELRAPARAVRGRALVARGRYVARQQRVGRRRFRAKPGKRIRVRVRINARGHAILRNRRRARGRIRVRQFSRSGQVLGETTRNVAFTARKWGRRRAGRGSRSR
jgi:hypothetical protein